ncbi:MAG: OmpA family protein [Deltaproteobacteria bacterium HGW-Deltaproteobacteria-20]|jgi:OOP family OmpA-OmpF porin|nr:MAG: OmpA family protein [Deltaproteobacteria bacterium HGW-Deltaproteobacteria-20]
MGRKLAASLIAIVFMGCTAQAQFGNPEEPATPAPASTPEPAPAATPAEPAPAVAPATPTTSAVKQEGGKLKMPGAIVFEFGKATLLPESEPVLDQLKLFLDQKPQITLVRIEGHTDNVGQAAANLKLSGERALAVRTWLVNKGIDGKRLISVGFGDLKPVADNKTDEGRAQNRRTEFIVVEVNSKPWLGADPTAGGTVFGDNPR